jgi:rSAM/selenodomain-associated transferase 2
MADLTVVIPVLDDSDALARQLDGLVPQPGIEIIVVDGAADMRLDELVAARPDVRLVRGVHGRGAQMNVGAGQASSPWLLFLHADCALPAGWASAITGSPSHIAGGWFQFALDDEAWQARLIERLVGWRVSLLGLAYGDQGLFLRHEMFEQLGGFREWPLMEDVDMVCRLRRAGRVSSLPLELRSSARRWRHDGWFRRSTRNLCLVLLYFSGVPPGRLARWYG